MDRPATGDPRRKAVIAFVEFSPSGGLFQFAAQLGEALAERGHEVHLFTGPRPELLSRHHRFVIHPVLPTWHPGEQRTRSALIRKPRRVVRAVQLALAWVILLVRLRRLRPDLVLWSTWRFLLDAVGVLLASAVLPSSDLGIVAHEPLPMSGASDTTVVKSGRILTPALAAAWRRMRIVFVLGEKAREAVRRHWEPNGPVVLIPHGDEKALLGVGPVPAVETTGPVVLFFGTWQRYKGIDVLLDAFERVRLRCPEAQLIIAGTVGADVDFSAISARAAEVGNVVLRPAYVPLDALPATFGSARAVVVPYVRAMQSGVAHLAFGFARPVVGTDVGDIPSIVRNGETGSIVPPGSPVELADALLRLLTDPAWASKLGAEGQRRLEQESSWAVVAAKMEEGWTARTA
jgi:glycosyltransferase involved in cell wall biosynthesis